MNYAHTWARHSSGSARLVLVSILLLASAFAASPATGNDSGSPSVALTPGVNAELARLFNSKDNPLPILPVIVGQVDTRARVEALIALGQRPIIFQISNGSGPDFNLAKVCMFSEMALEYPNTVNFVNAPAGSEAAKARSTKPLFV